MKARLFNCADKDQEQWLKKVWDTLYRYKPNKYRELDMLDFLPHYANKDNPVQLAQTLIHQGKYDARCTYRYELDVIQGKQPPTSYNGRLIKYMPISRILKLQSK